MVFNATPACRVATIHTRAPFVRYDRVDPVREKFKHAFHSRFSREA
ncbi:hypothetical protein LMA00_21510 [Burkholderia ambifaria]|nr:hypothetical protein LMA00_21510 [Burkholderia ambifaria]